ncbi:unnamed protein product [Cercopithifilaria johnstoni]|uniref:Uncharacterized protein n=1 Tax=Cercopithifilaria johnstoni TaxID=2874296 RepID=A0A8J2LY31_9BILA|nr:unnamed protein product [Cercopithifilaria johnstoni]
MISDATMDTPTTLKHRHRHKFNKMLGKYTRMKKPGLERTSKHNSTVTNSIIDSTSNFYVTYQVTNATNNIGSSVRANISNIAFINETTKISFIWNIFAPRASDIFMATTPATTKTTTATTTSTVLSTTRTPRTTTLATTLTTTTTTATVPMATATTTEQQKIISPIVPKILKDVQIKQQTEAMQFLSSSPSIETTINPRFTVSQTTLKMYPEDHIQEILDPLKVAKTFQHTTTTITRVRRSNFTLVTALLDIGRGDWWEYRRPLESYYNFLENLLKLKVNLVIFVDLKSVRHVYTQRKLYRLEHITKIIPITLAELPLYRYVKAAMKVIADEQNDKRWDQQWDRSMSSHPEAKSAKYDILVNSKSYFLYNASKSNPFKSEFFAWLDAGYAHGNQSIFPPSFHWNPTFVRRKISLIKVTPSYDNISRYTLADLYRKNWAVISGGFLGGDIYSLNRFHQLCHQMVVNLIYRKYVDDDQTTLVLLIQQYPSLFNVIHGDWFDAFYLFP